MRPSEQIIKNAVFLCKVNKKKIGDMEKEIGVSPGYLSRCKGWKTISVDTAMRIAKYLDLTLNDLIYRDIETLFAIEEKQSQIAKLYEEIKELEGGQWNACPGNSADRSVGG